MFSVGWLAAAGLVMATAGYTEQSAEARLYGDSAGYGSQPPRAAHFQLVQDNNRDRDRNRDGIPDRYQQGTQPDAPRSLLYLDPPDSKRSIMGPSSIQDPPRDPQGSSRSLLR